MEKFDLILHTDWLDMINPLVDSSNNTVFIRSGDEPHIVSGVPTAAVKSCGIKDHVLAGLHNNFSRLHSEDSSPLKF